MSEMEMNDDVETEEFTDELSDEALDRMETKFSGRPGMTQPGICL
jgi:hypothetical protein